MLPTQSQMAGGAGVVFAKQTPPTAPGVLLIASHGPTGPPHVFNFTSSPSAGKPYQAPQNGPSPGNVIPASQRRSSDATVQDAGSEKVTTLAQVQTTAY